MALSDYLRPDLFRPRNLVPAGVAVVVMAGAWFGIRQTTQTDESPPAPQQASAPAEASASASEAPPEAEPQIFPHVLVASRDIGRGVLLNLSLMEWQEWLEPIDLSRAVIRDAVPLESVIGAVTRRKIEAGELITWENIVMAGMPGFVTTVLAPDHRAMTVSVDESTTRAQIIYPGDHVDVILVHTPGSGGVPAADLGGDAGPASQVIVRDVRVLAVGSTTMDMNRYGTTSIAAGGVLQRPEPPSGETYTLEVSTTDAERIALASIAGRLTLVVRPVAAATVAGTTQGTGSGPKLNPVRFVEVMKGLGPSEEELLPPELTIRIVRGRGRSSEEVLQAREDARAEEDAARLLAEALRDG